MRECLTKHWFFVHDEAIFHVRRTSRDHVGNFDAFWWKIMFGVRGSKMLGVHARMAHRVK